MSLLFVYGTLKLGYRNNHILGNSELLDSVETVDRYQLLDLGSFPAMTKQDTSFHIRGQLYSISIETLARCDRLEGHPDFYKREIIKVRNGALVTHAWAYFLVKPDNYPRAVQIGSEWTKK